MNWYELRRKRSQPNSGIIPVSPETWMERTNSMNPCLDTNRVRMSTRLARYRCTTSFSDKLHLLANFIRQWLYKPVQFRNAPYSVVQL
jgi:hypothetical protein